jgi:hypothetical protein
LLVGLKSAGNFIRAAQVLPKSGPCKIQPKKNAASARRSPPGSECGSRDTRCLSFPASPHAGGFCPVPANRASTRGERLRRQSCNCSRDGIIPGRLGPQPLEAEGQATRGP